MFTFENEIIIGWTAKILGEMVVQETFIIKNLINS